MWREYTRETPARPGLAILAAALALIGTTALAWVVVQRANPRRVEAPAYWPIRFTLPDRYERTVIDYGESAIELIDGSVGAALYTSGGPDETIGFIHVRYELLPKSTNFNDAAEVLTGADF